MELIVITVAFNFIEIWDLVKILGGTNKYFGFVEATQNNPK